MKLITKTALCFRCHTYMILFLLPLGIPLPLLCYLIIAQSEIWIQGIVTRLRQSVKLFCYNRNTRQRVIIQQ